MEMLLIVLAGPVLLVAAFNPWALLLIALDLLGLRVWPWCQGRGVDVGARAGQAQGARIGSRRE